jgi:hypothetical protein
MMMVADDACDDCKSSQLIIVPFRLSLTGPISNVDSTGKLSLVDVLEKLNAVELIINSRIVAALAESEEAKIREISVAVVSFSRITLNLHSRWIPVVVHVNSS